MTELHHTTICALATPAATGALAVVRISGPDALTIASHVFTSSSCPDLTQSAGYKMHYGHVCDAKGQMLDQVLLSVFRAPHSFTGEDCVEIYTHGSLYIQNALIQSLIANGAVPAAPGEFSQRAFLNGKMDLTQAEAIADLIASESEAAHRLALDQMRGHFAQELAVLREQLLELASLMELELDFSEEDVEFADRTRLTTLLDALCTRITRLCDSFQAGNALKNGVPVAIVGTVNAGKSTLLNAILGEDRAIVSPIAGTTRDTVEDAIQLDGIRFRFIDTAGLRQVPNAPKGSQESIEELGVARSLHQIEKASIILLVLDSTRPDTFEESIDQVCPRISHSGATLFLIYNKIDKLPHADPSSHNKTVINLCANIHHQPVAQIFEISATQKTGLDALLSAILQNTRQRTGLAHPTLLLTNARHYHALQQSLQALTRVKTGLLQQIPTDLLTLDLRQALHFIGTITGQVTTDEILGAIFGRFCIGK